MTRQSRQNHVVKDNLIHVLIVAGYVCIYHIVFEFH